MVKILVTVFDKKTIAYNLKFRGGKYLNMLFPSDAVFPFLSTRQNHAPLFQLNSCKLINTKASARHSILGDVFGTQS